MSIFKKFSNIMKHKWEHEDPEIRRNAVIEIPEKNIEHLTAVVLNDPDEDIALIALRKINDTDVLDRVIELTGKPKLVHRAEKKLRELLKKEVIKNGRSDLIDRIVDEKDLTDIVIESSDDDCKLKAFERLTLEDSFYKIAKNAGSTPYTLQSIEYIEREQYLRDIKSNAKYGKARKKASDKFKELYEQKDKVSNLQTDDTDHSEELEIITEYAERLIKTEEFEKFEKVLQEKVEIWSKYDPYGSSEYAPRFYKAIKIFEEKKKAFNEKQSEIKRKQELQKELTAVKKALCEEIESLNPSHETTEEVREIRQKWLETYSLEDEDTENKFQARFTKASDRLKDQVIKFLEEEKLYNELTEKVNGLKEVIESNNLDKITQVLKSLPKLPSFRFYYKDKVKELRDIIENFKKKANEYIASQKNHIKEKNDALYADLKNLIEGIKPLIEMEDRHEALNQIKLIQEKWKELKGETIESLSKKYKSLSDEFWTKQKEFYEEQKWDRWANKENKNALIRIVEKTSEIADIRKVAKIIREAQKKWKEYGPVPKEDSEPMWERFHKACEENYARCTKYFEELDKKRQENLEYCKQIVERAKEALSSEDLIKAVKDFKEFGVEWKKHSELPRPEGDDLYKEFRKISDEFFSKYGEFRQEIDSSREENQKKRDEAIEKIKKMVKDGEDDIKKCIALQKEVYALGPGLKEKETETRKAFRDASDAFFESIDKNREKNIPLKEKICEEAEKLAAQQEESETAATPWHEILNKIYKLQREWRKTGPLPKKQENLLWDRFTQACTKTLNIDLTRSHDEIKAELASKAEEVSDSTQWRDATDKLRFFQIQWNLLSHGSDEEQWKKFRGACDKFFNRKKEHFAKADSEREKNLVEKEGLIARIEILAKEKHNIETNTESDSAKKSVSLADELKMAIENNFVVSSISGSGMNEEIRRIQDQWKKIGFVPREKDNDIWNRYRKALDMFYKGNVEDTEENQSKKSEQLKSEDKTPAEKTAE